MGRRAARAWGMMLRSSASLYSGAGGRSRPSIRNGVRAGAAGLASDALPGPASAVISSSPCRAARAGTRRAAAGAALAARCREHVRLAC